MSPSHLKQVFLALTLITKPLNKSMDCNVFLKLNFVFGHDPLPGKLPLSLAISRLNEGGNQVGVCKLFDAVREYI